MRCDEMRRAAAVTAAVLADGGEFGERQDCIARSWLPVDAEESTDKVCVCVFVCVRPRKGEENIRDK